MLSQYMNNKGVHMTDEDKEQMDQKSFLRKHKNVTSVESVIHVLVNLSLKWVYFTRRLITLSTAFLFVCKSRSNM
jgi:hypothetical protein